MFKISSILFWILFTCHELRGQQISRNDSLRTLFQEKNEKTLSKLNADTTITTNLAEKTRLRIAELIAIRDNEKLPAAKRIKAQWGLVRTYLYKDPRKSYKDLMKYVSLTEQFRDSSTALWHAYSSLGFYYRKLGYFDSARVAFNKGLAFAREKKYRGAIQIARIDLCVLEESLGNYDLAMTEYLDILDSTIALKTNEIEARCRINLGNLYNLKGDYLNGLHHLKNALDLCTIRKINGYMASIYIYMGDVNLAIGELETAESQYKNALKWSDLTNNSQTKRLTLIQFSILREKQGKFEEALALSRSLIEFSKSTDIPNESAENFFLIAELFQKNGQTDSALFYIQKSLNLFAEIENQVKFYKALGIAGRIYLDRNNIALAEKFCLQSYQILPTQTDLEQKKANCDCLYQVYRAKKEDRKALGYLEQYLEIEKIMNNKEEALILVKQQLRDNFKYSQYKDSVNNKNALRLVELENNQKWEKRSRTILFLATGLGFVILGALALSLAFRQNRRQKRDLDRLNRLNKQIFSIISHDFRGPMLSMNMLVDTLKTAEMNEQRMHMYLNDIGHQISQTTNVLDNLLNWARAELQLDISRNPNTPLLQIVQEMKEVFATRLAEKNIDFKIEVNERDNLEIHPDLLRILLRNLLSNAIKYSFQNGVIAILYEASSGTLSVRDSGVGMSAETLENLLKAPVYSRLGTAQESGFGIGLYITGELLRKIGWTLIAESKLGEGTVFFVKTKG